MARRRTYEEEGVLDGRAVVHGAEEVLLQGEDHQLLEEAVAHHELLGRARDVAVVVQHAHARETAHLHLERHVRGLVNVDHRLAGRVRARGHVGLEHRLERLVPDLVDHCKY